MNKQTPISPDLIYPSEEFAGNAQIKSFEEYKHLYKKSIESPEEFWGGIAGKLHWFKKWDTVFTGNKNFKWFDGAKTNIAYNCLDIHLSTWRRNKAAIIWESEPGETRILTYQSLYNQVCRLSNALKKNGIKKGDKVIVYMGMTPELAISMLACARIGAVHVVVHNGFNAGALKKRILDSKAKMIITGDAALKRGAKIFLKKIVDEIADDCPELKKVIVFKRFSDLQTELNSERDLLWNELLNNSKDDHKPDHVDPEHPLFILYVSGEDYPAGIVHSTAGYMVQTYITAKWLFDLKDEDVFWCTADLGWIAGHSYVLYGALLNGATTLLYEGTPNFPDNERTWQIISRHKVNIFYTTPTSVRAFHSWGEELIKKYNLSSLRLLAIGGEPISPQMWKWFYKVVGKNKCPVIHTWMQTETGNILLAPLPGAIPLKPGSCTFPFPGVVPEIVDTGGNPVPAGQEGFLTIKNTFPSMLTKINNSRDASEKYWQRFPGKYFTGDTAEIDKDGYLWVKGRSDNVINVAGHRISMNEIKNILLLHQDVKEAEVLPKPDDIRGTSLTALVKLKDKEPSLLLQEELRDYVEKEIGTFAKPDEVKFITE